MTNAQIITNARFALMEQGIIGTTGRTIKFLDGEGNEKELPEPEQIHTYQTWKELGYQVKKGSKAVARFTIWKHVEGKKNQDTDEETPSRMFMKNASWFSASQVEAITA